MNIVTIRGKYPDDILKLQISLKAWKFNCFRNKPVFVQLLKKSIHLELKIMFIKKIIA